MESINPATGERIADIPAWDDAGLDRALEAVARATPAWRDTGFGERARLVRRAAAELRARLDEYAALITREMGKLLRESRAEIEKCAWGCEYYADHAEEFLRDERIATDAGTSYVACQPLGTVLAIMPWNFPFWQVFRFAATALMAGNTAVLKHASNVPGCALAIEDVFRRAGFPPDVFRALLIPTALVERVIADRRISAVTLTGSDGAGRHVAAAAGKHLKKTVLELGGSDAFVVLEDADLEEAATVGAAARMQNAGQSCIAAKRFVLVEAVAEPFLARFKERIRRLKPGDPMREETTLAPLAREDLRRQLHAQVTDSIAAGAKPLLGCEPLPGPGFYYAPSILDRVRPGMRAYEEELFGPVAIVLRARDEADALRLANDSRFGLGASVWTRDPAKGERLARAFEAGSCFVNGMVKSDPRLPFGGVKDSGYGRELSAHGIREFVNVKTVWVR
ncbi:succinate-semialdehyde dehdyrogenase [Sulfurifustis variabilis]|uniref:Succinate-semialdehyde dehdyrogenase n=1 Tax=Sulfurifustis variabilis TaxID=1675686 RepID=A0A1B4V6B2_9GAMM|nr:NAD-dependent succinate-semialdehyde dehydrogenase [Sulfurifustis variabilis]BAU46734.1 succinate-semialdehyde dehdyrogenase [Sulfurifustis variabilis]